MLAIPDNFADLYSIPPSAMNFIRNILTRDLPIRIESPAQVALFEYDNNTFIIQNFAPTEATITIQANAQKLHNLLTDDSLSPAQAARGRGLARGRGTNNPDFIPARTPFTLTLKPHSYQAFSTE